MARALKVYAWLGAYPRDFEKPADEYHRVQARCVVAAHSSAEFLRITGLTRASLPYVSETGNDAAVAVAMSKPGTVFFQDDLNHKPSANVYLEHSAQGRH